MEDSKVDVDFRPGSSYALKSIALKKELSQSRVVYDPGREAYYVNGQWVSKAEIMNARGRV